MPGKRLFCGLILACVLCVTSLTYAGGLSTTFSEVKAEGLKTGYSNSHSMQKDSNFPLSIQNTSETAVDLQIQVLSPQAEELKEGYEPIPDTSWITLQQDSFHLEPGGEAKTDVVITVPAEDIYKGKKYQVYIWSHTVGRSLGVGLKSRLLFTTRE